MALRLDISDIFAGLALLVSAYAVWKTVQFNNRQRGLIESQERLNRWLLAKEAAESISDQKADLGANFLKIGSGKYRLKIFNKGKAAALNVSIEFPEGNDCFIESDVSEKFPLEILEPYQSVEIVAVVALGTKSKHVVRLIWDDGSGRRNDKIVYPTL